MPNSYFIGGKQGGLQTNVKPFWILDQSYEEIVNCLGWRERTRKKPGWSLVGRLQRNLENLSQTATQAGATYTDSDLLNSVRVAQPNAQIVVGSVILTIDPGGGNETIYNDNGDGTFSYISGPFDISSSSLNYATGAVSLTYSATQPGAAVSVEANLSYYPGLPVLGITSQELTAINSEEGVFFDRIYAYNFSGGSFQEYPSNTPTTWTNPNDSNLFWYTNYYATVPQTQALWVTNNIDNIRYYDLASSPATWTTFTPQLDGSGTLLNSCLLIVPFKGRLLAFNTLEGATRFSQRVRYSQQTLVGPPTNANAWRSDIAGRGGYVDAPTSEVIISLRNIKDRLIVYFESSTWELVYTGNETLPFVFRQLNQELGCESTFSTVPFDNGILGIGSVGIHTCNGVNVVRFDELIPDEVFKINNLSQGPQRISAVRDYQLETVYWSYPEAELFEFDTQKFPNKVFCYNYRNNTWAEFIESFTVYGYFQPNSDFTWDTLPYETWDEWEDSWDSGLPNARNPVVCSGNQQGFVFTFNKEYSASTDYSRFITAISGSQVTSPDHNFNNGDYIIFNYNEIIGVTFSQTELSFKITNVIDKDNFEFDGSVTGSYLGNGLIKKLDNFKLRTKEFNPFLDQGEQVRFSSVDFLIDNQSNGAFEVDFYLNDSQATSISPLTGTNEIEMSASSLVPIQGSQSTIWKRKNVNAIGQYIQMEMKHSEDQMRNPLLSQDQFVLHAMHIRLSPSGRINPS